MANSPRVIDHLWRFVNMASELRIHGWHRLETGGIGGALPTPISVSAASVAGRALCVPSGWACGPPFPRPVRP